MSLFSTTREESNEYGIHAKSEQEALRFVTFNVNGAKTLFNYHPWNCLSLNYGEVFQVFEADVISLQELKLTPTNISSVKLTNLDNFSSFISVPKRKKGYSGVGLFVRTPKPEELSHIRQALTILKAEEGITGILNSPDFPGKRYKDLDIEDLIGGYPKDLDEQRAMRLDSEGRCICVELGCNVVVFSLYCPANSIRTEGGELFRLEFLKVLLDRCSYLKKELKKEVILLGDINVCLDLIDSADEINERAKKDIIDPRTINPKKSGGFFEEVNYAECINFKSSRPARLLLNEYVFSSIALLSLLPFNTENQFLFDVVRIKQERRMFMYTVWNTLTNSRQTNYGSRIDLILTSSEVLKNSLLQADIWPLVIGSDHCPAFADFNLDAFDFVSPPERKKLKLEARYFFRLPKHRDISEIFQRTKVIDKKVPQDTKFEVSKTPLKYTSRKITKRLSNTLSILSFFESVKSNKDKEKCQGDNEV